MLDLIALDADRRAMRNHIRRACEGEPARNVELMTRTESGQHVDLLLGIYPIRDEFDAIVGASLLARDVTAQKRAERDVRQAVRQRDQFLAMLSHELRNPLSAVLNGVHLLEREGLDQGLKERAHAIVGRQTRHMARLLDDLLDVSRMRQDQIEMRKERVDLRVCVEAVLEAAQARLDESRVELEVSLPASPVWIDADPARIQQVVTNLVTNATRYTPPGKQAWLTVERDGDEAVVRVRDEGQGIAPDMLERIFEPFVRAAHLSQEPIIGSDANEGMGLGLALVRSIVHAHGGSVTADSDGLDCGAEFAVRLPLADGADHVEHLPTDRARACRELPLVVLVEDQLDNQALLKAILEDHDYAVVAASDGPGGLQAILEHQPDIAIVDVGLPGMRGDEVARRVREEMPDGELLLVAVTGFGQQDDRNAIFEAGFDHHLVKPVDIDVLLEVIGGRVAAAPAE